MTPAWPLPRLIAHRGGGLLAPENTLAGIRVAARCGYRAVEFDVMLSKDCVPVLIHDETLARTSNGRGRVCDRPYSELAALDAGGWFAPQFVGEPIPRLDQALDLCRTLGMAANVEIKPATGADSQTGRITAEWAAAHGSDVAIVLSSFSMIALSAAAQDAPRLSRGVLFDTPPGDWIEIVRNAAATSMHCNWTSMRPTILAGARSANVPLVVYTCDDPREAQRLLDDGVASVITDRPDLLTNPLGCGL